MKKIIILFLSFLFILSCKEAKNNSNDNTQMEEVMAIHDEVMPKMGKIGSLVAALRKKIDTDQGSAIDKKAMEDLQDAHKTMMDWMQGFGDKFDSDEILNGKTLTLPKLKLLDEEEKKVNIVKEKINTSIAKAEILLAE